MKKENVILGICSIFLLVIFGKMLKNEWVDVERITSKKELIGVLKNERNASHSSGGICRSGGESRVLNPAELKKCEGVRDLSGSSGSVLSPASLKSTDSGSSSSSSSKLSEDFSKTNAQEEGIDEGDNIKTDGKYFYKVNNNHLEKIKLNGKISKTIEYANETKLNEVYVDGQKVVVIGQKNSETIVDIYTKQTMKKERSIKMEGSAIGVRKINDYMYVVVDKEIGYDESIEASLPTYRDSLVMKNEKEINFDDFHYGPKRKLDEYVTIYSLSITKKEPLKMSTFLGSGNGIYMSENAVYLTATEESETVLHQFVIDKESVVFKRVGKVEGHTLNQFSMDEYKGYVRIATTNTQGNHVYVLNEKLKQVGSIEQLAVGEQMKSVRFMGDKGYVVTFEQIDPLFTLDLHDPKKPTVKGELKIPGYSSYLHPYGDHKLIGFGVDNGVKLSLFDIENMNYPIEEFSQVIGDSDTTSRVLNDHRAFFFSKEDQLIGFKLSNVDDRSYYVLVKVNEEKGFQIKRAIEISEDEEENPRAFYIGKNIYVVTEENIYVYDRKTLEKKSSEKLIKP
jgi:uncharacterized secreted protein with C-terminal beta-propeller domain